MILALPLYAASVEGGIPIRGDLFWSEEELAKMDFNAQLTDDEREYYENTHIYLVTASPADPVYVYFGHAGIAVDAPDRDEIMFDYGSFRFSDGFYINFILGRLYYSCIETYASYRYDDFIRNDRTIKKIELMMTPEAKKATLAFLSYNVLPENETYLYHYNEDNCATRPRDIYNATTGGAFKSWAEDIECGTYRSWSTLYLSKSLFFNYVLNFLQGPSVDKPITLYEATFLPDLLMKAIEEYEGSEAETVYQTKSREALPEHYSLVLDSLPVLFATAVIILLTASNKKWIRVIAHSISAIIYLFLAVLSTALVLFMCFSNHDVTYGNWNILILPPFILALSAMHIASLGKKERRKSIAFFSRIMLITTLVLLSIKGCFLSFFIQDNIVYYLTAIILYGSEICATALSSYRSIPSSHLQYAQDQ